ncbi:MAG: hypothetical protein WA709_15990 [Stellaceae bacterium]
MLDKHVHSSLEKTPPAHPSDDDCRELARKIREVAGQTRLAVARRELLRLAANYERGGDHLDRRTQDCHPIFASFP